MRRTVVYRDPLFLAHQTGRDYLESPRRFEAIDRELDRSEVASQLFFPIHQCHDCRCVPPVR